MVSKHALPVIEIFGPTLQGEGAMIGNITHFIRFGGCEFRCTWCDSMHAVDPKAVRRNSRYLSIPDIVEELRSRPNAEWVTLSGGNPALHDLTNLIEALHKEGWKIAMETQGSVFKNWMSGIDYMTISPKGPSSGMVDKFDSDVFKQIIEYVDYPIVKIVVFDNDDLLFASQLHEKFQTLSIKWYLSIGTRPHHTAQDILDNWRQVAEKVMYKWGTLKAFAILPQSHVLLWGHKQGV